MTSSSKQKFLVGGMYYRAQKRIPVLYVLLFCQGSFHSDSDNKRRSNATANKSWRTDPRRSVLDLENESFQQVPGAIQALPTIVQY